jgi:hypothetical protein
MGIILCNCNLLSMKDISVPINHDHPDCIIYLFIYLFIYLLIYVLSLLSGKPGHYDFVPA